MHVPIVVDWMSFPNAWWQLKQLMNSYELYQSENN